MIPLGDNNPTRTKPYVVYGLVAVNVLVFLVAQTGLLRYWSMVPWSVIHDMRAGLAFNQFGQVLADPSTGLPAIEKMPGVGPHPQWITIFTSMFMHGSWMHIGGNMLYLWIFGNNIEDTLGHVKFFLFYILCGVLAALAHIFMSMHSLTGPFIPTVGASGAIAGVLGAYIVLFPTARVNTLVTLWFFWDYVAIPAVYVLGVWFLMQLTGTFGTGGQVGGGVAYWAHVGGFVSGAIIVLLVGGRAIVKRRRAYLSPYNEDRPYFGR